MAGVSLKHVFKRYGKTGPYVVKDFDLDIHDGEFMVFVGPSGCGKSTTLRMVAGLENISEGEIYIGDKLVNRVPPKKRDIAMVFQNYALYPNMSVFENIAFGLRLRKQEKHLIDSNVKSVARTLEIEHLLERRPRQLSGGQRQRVALGRSIVREPTVFLMDEPLSNLDARLRVQMREELIALHRRLGTTMIYVTHDQVEAMTMGTRICIMKDGVIQQVGTPEQVYLNPANTFVANFIGSPPINFVQGHMKELQSGESVFDTKKFSIPVPAEAARTLFERTSGMRRITLGVRPEFVHLARELEGLPGAVSFPAVVRFTELIGADRYVHLELGEDKLVMRVPAHRRFADGETLAVGFHPDQLLFFEQETQELVCKSKETFA